jgi:hypothetical protein
MVAVGTGGFVGGLAVGSAWGAEVGV